MTGREAAVNLASRAASMRIIPGQPIAGTEAADVEAQFTLLAL
jgi:hypothetical protein